MIKAKYNQLEEKNGRINKSNTEALSKPNWLVENTKIQMMRSKSSYLEEIKTLTRNYIVQLCKRN